MLPELLLIALQVGAARTEVPPRPPVQWSVEQLSERCLEFVDEGKRVNVTRCVVRESGEFGNFAGDAYFYALYCVEEKDLPLERCDDPTRAYGHGSAAAAVFVRQNGARTLRVITSAIIDGGVFRRPTIVANIYGAIMELPRIVAATCDCNASAYYVWQAETRQWLEADFTAWQADLSKHLPVGLTVWNSPWPDLRTMTVRGALWRNDDAHCCPTGGEFTAELTIMKNQFALKSVQFVAPARAIDPSKR